ncbi:MAG TPA: hypothetical protein VNL16_02455 [Chloroflexota bacterium]|nr:hypothetical protein [Chloroflexota bacterium]
MQHREIEKVDDAAEFEISPEEDAQLRAMIDQAEKDIVELRVNLRWHKLQLDTVKKAAALYDMPYQTYVKAAAYRQALADLQTALDLHHAMEGQTPSEPLGSRTSGQSPRTAIAVGQSRGARSE